MDEKYLWPLIGVALGWILNLASSGFKDREESRRQYGKLMTQLLRVQTEIFVLVAVCEQFKDFSNGVEQYETIRKRVTDRHFLEPESMLDTLSKTIEDISGTDPHLAIELQKLLGLLRRNKNTSLATASAHRDAYIKMLSLYEVSLDMTQKALTKRIRQLAFRHGLFTYGHLLYINYIQTRSRASSNNFAAKFLDEVQAELMPARGEKPVPAQPNDQK